MKHDEVYWSDRYDNNQIQWDAGSITTPLKSYFDQIEDKDLKILIPGCGNAYEAEYLWAGGFKNVYVADISLKPLQNFAQRVPGFPESHLLHVDFFKLEDKFDLIVEQTFFCALHPSEREAYLQQVKSLLKQNGKLAGVLFDDKLNSDHPPYGGKLDDYLPLFSRHFNVKTMEGCYNSIKSREGRELFIIMKNK